MVVQLNDCKFSEEMLQAAYPHILPEYLKALRAWYQTVNNLPDADKSATPFDLYLKTNKIFMQHYTTNKNGLHPRSIAAKELFQKHNVSWAQ